MKKRKLKKLVLKAWRQRDDAMVIADGWRHRAETIHRKHLAAKTLLDELERKVPMDSEELLEKARRTMAELSQMCKVTESYRGSHRP